MVEIGWFNPHDGAQTFTENILLQQWTWTIEAACNGADSDLFYCSDKQYDRAYLTALCNRCPVRHPCFHHAVTHDEHGWWAGTTRRDRKEMRWPDHSKGPCTPTDANAVTCDSRTPAQNPPPTDCAHHAEADAPGNS